MANVIESLLIVLLSQPQLALFTISYMIKVMVIAMLLVFNTTMALAQDVRYYKLTRKVENGASSQ